VDLERSFGLRGATDGTPVAVVVELCLFERVFAAEPLDPAMLENP
jgi:hypothetical protein